MARVGGPLAHGEAGRHEADQNEEQDEPQSRRHCPFFGATAAELIPRKRLRHG